MAMASTTNLTRYATSFLSSARHGTGTGTFRLRLSFAMAISRMTIRPAITAR